MNDNYLTPFEAAQQLERPSTELGEHGVAAEDNLEALRQLERRFSRHLNGREAVWDLLRDVAELELVLC